MENLGRAASSNCLPRPVKLGAVVIFKTAGPSFAPMASEPGRRARGRFGPRRRRRHRLIDGEGRAQAGPEGIQAALNEPARMALGVTVDNNDDRSEVKSILKDTDGKGVSVQ